MRSSDRSRQTPRRSTAATATGKQFATLKSALLSRSLVRDLKPDETFTALDGVSFTVPQGRTLGMIGRNGSGKSTMLKLRRRHHEAHDRRR